MTGDGRRRQSGRGVLPIPRFPRGRLHGAVGSSRVALAAAWQRWTSTARARRSSVVSAVLTALLVTAGVVYGVTSDDYPVTDAELHDYGIWVTNHLDVRVGRFNAQARALESPTAVPDGSAQFDVVQDDAIVLVVDSAHGSLTPLDPVTGTLGRQVVVPASAGVDMRGGRIAVLDPAEGALWARPAAEIAALQTTSDPPQVTGLGSQADLAVAVDGSVLAVPANGERLVVLPAGADTAATKDLDGLTAERAQVSAVGTDPVVLDRASGRVWLPGGRVATVPTAQGDAQLQQPGPAADTVLVATGSDLYAVGITTGEVTSLYGAGTGSPARPVHISGCDYGAWNAGLSYVTVCGGQVHFEGAIGPDAAHEGDELVYRVNRGAAVLNNIRDGVLIRPDEEQLTRQDWSAASRSATVTGDEIGTEEDSRTEEAQQSGEKNHPPEPQPDRYGTRAGRAVIARVLENDTDPDGDVLSISASLGEVAGGTAAVIQDGQAIQVTPDAEATRVSFRYTVSDPDGATADAEVTVTVTGAETAPTLRAGATLETTVRAGHRVEIDVLSAFIDPENDPLYATVGRSDGPGTARVTPTGVLTYVDSGAAPGVRQIPIEISDGRQRTTAAVRVNVVDDVPTPPVARPDVVLGTAGTTLSAFPLVNDVDLGNQPLHLVKVAGPAGLDVRVAPGGTRVDIEGAEPGRSYELAYEVANDDKSANGTLRVDTRAEDAPKDPIAVDDALFLPATGTGDVDLLANDSSPSGQVLVVQDVAGPDGSLPDGLQFAVLDHRVLRVWSTAQLTDPVPFSYVVSDGTGTARATALVSSPPTPPTNHPPAATDDAVIVQCGDVVDVPVLANDSDPDGDALSLRPTVAGVPEAAVASVRGDVVRFQAPAAPGTLSVTYSVADPSGDVASGQLVVTVRQDPLEQNAPPSPPDLVGRALQGETIRVALPPGDRDPDGDSVVVLGADSPPRLGQVSVESGTILSYRSFADAVGTDTFSYRVADSRGQTATAEVRIGVAPRPDGVGNLGPVAVDDPREIRPQRAVSVAPLANDVDPDGDTLHLAADRSPEPTPAGSGTVRQVEDRLEVTAAAEGSFAVGYTADDGRGGQSEAYVTIRAAADAPLLAPVPRDDVVPAGAPGVVSVPVLANDDDPDGRVADLSLEAIGPHADAADVQPDGALAISRGSAAMVVAYRITDQDGLSDQGFVWVPGAENQPPRLRDGVTVGQGEHLALPLDQVVVDPEGHPVALTDAPISALRGQVAASGGSALDYVAPGQAGEDTLSFTVIDDPGRDGRPASARLDVPVRVTSPESTPVLRGSRMSLTAGETPREVDLRSFVSEPGAPADTRYRFEASVDHSAVVSAEIRESALVATPRAAGEATVTVTVTNVVTGRQGSGPVHVTVAAAASVPPAPHDYTVTGRQGAPVALPWRANVVAAPGAELTVDGVRVTPADAGQVTSGSDSLTFTPNGDWTGTAAVTYRVSDVAAQPARSVPARAVVVIQGVPGAPGTPELARQSRRSATLTWTPAASNGSPVTGYTVSAGDGGPSAECPQTACTLDGLPLGRPLRFSVAATNAVGTGPASPASEPITVDDRPDVPSAPRAAFVAGGAGGRITVTWPAVAAPGGGAVTYRVAGSPSGGPAEVTGTSYTFTGLDNGTAYTFKVAASAGGPYTEYGPASAPESPAGVPDPPAVTAVTQSGTRVIVTWSAPATNGAPVTRYTVRSVRGGSATTVDAGTSQTATLDAGQPDAYQFSVQATNKSGTSDFGAMRALTVAAPPGRVGAVTATAGDKSATLSFAAATGDVQRYEYSQNGGGWNALNGSRVVSGLSNGTSYRFTVRACSATSCGDASEPSNAVVPLGAPSTPVRLRADASAAMEKPTFSWCAPAENGRPIVATEYRFGGQSWVTAAGSGCPSVTQTMSDYGTVQIEVRAVDSDGQRSDAASTSYTLRRGTMTATQTASRTVLGEGITVETTYSITFHGDFPRGLPQVAYGYGRQGSCGFPQVLSTGLTAPFSDRSTSVVGSLPMNGAYECGFRATNPWNGETLKYVTGYGNF